MPRRKQNKRVASNPLRPIFTRYMIIVAVLILWIGVIGVRLVQLQVTQHDWLRQKAASARTVKHKRKMLRGTIYDREDRVLAMSIRANSLFADPKLIDDPGLVAGKLAKVLKLDKRKLAARLREGKDSGRRFTWIARKVDENTFKAVNEEFASTDDAEPTTVDHPGLGWKKEQKREYPQKQLASHVIGFSDADDRGRAGVEQSQEDVLKGEVVSTVRERDRLGRVYEETGVKREAPKDIVLTIDNSIQYTTEEALAAGVKAANAKAGRAIVLDPKTGEILAMANYPTFDPNNYSKDDPAIWRNSAVQDNFSPGSVMKMVTYGAALEEGKISPDAYVDCGIGKLTVGGYTFSDSHAVGDVTFTKAFAQSSNVGAIKTGQRVGRQDFYNFVRKFGFGSRTGVELPAEAPGILSPPTDWGSMTLASMSIGYEIGVTSLQTAVAFATIANDGVKVQPHIIKEIRESDGKPVSSLKPKTERVVSEATARELRKMLREVVLNGTAKQAQLHGYSSAGKTGTAWKYDPQLRRVNREKYIASFVGFAPADDPRIVIAITIDEPKGALRYGGQVAAPVFRQIADQVLADLKVLPDGTVPDIVPAYDDPSEDPLLAAGEPGVARPDTDRNTQDERSDQELSAPEKMAAVKPKRAAEQKNKT